MNVHGLNVTGITYRDPKNSLPLFVRAEAETRGYGDATQPLSLFIQEGDIEEAFACAAQGNGASCVMAQAGKRIGAKSVYFYRTTVWVDFGDGPIVRFNTSKQVYHNVIDPFDRGARDEIVGGIYHLVPPTRSRRLGTLRGRGPKPAGVNLNGSRKPVHHAHTERVVMATRAS